MEQPLVNRVEQSNLQTINLEKFLPNKDSYALIDLKGFLFKEFILKEKDFREALKQKDWEVYNGKHVAVFCSNDAIIPQWAGMLIATYLEPIAHGVYFKSAEELTAHLTLQAINNHSYDSYENKPTIIKGCGTNVTEEAYIAVSLKLMPIAKSIMYGEACSTVPIYKQKKSLNK